jgi:RNA polymerase sigma factor (sigma-70 family)
VEFLEDLEDVCRRVYPRLVGALSLYGASHDVAEELAQETLVRLIERWDTIRSPGAVDGWCYRTAMNLANSAARRRKIERRAQQRLTAPRAAAVDPDDLIVVREALMRLPRRQRQAVVLRFYTGLSTAETAGAMGCSPGTVKAHLNRAMRSLREAGVVSDDAEVPTDA